MPSPRGSAVASPGVCPLAGIAGRKVFFNDLPEAPKKFGPPTLAKMSILVLFWDFRNKISQIKPHQKPRSTSARPARGTGPPPRGREGLAGHFFPVSSKMATPLPKTSGNFFPILPAAPWWFFFVRVGCLTFPVCQSPPFPLVPAYSQKS